MWNLQLLGGKIPQDRTVIRRVLRTLSIPLLICMWVITTIGILVAVSLIVFNVLNHHRRYVYRYALIVHALSVCVLIDERFIISQGHRTIIPGLQHHNVVRLCAEFEQHLLIWLGWSNHIAGRFPEHMPNKNVGIVDRIHPGLRSHVQQGVEGAQVAHESKEKCYKGELIFSYIMRTRTAYAMCAV